MRMRHKKNLEERLEKVQNYLITLRNDSLNFNDVQNEKHLLDLKELFGNDNPVYLEVGCGMGTFGVTYAKQNPNINLICVEKVRDVICTACEKAKAEELTNIKFFGLCGGISSVLPAGTQHRSYIPELLVPLSKKEPRLPQTDGRQIFGHIQRAYDRRCSNFSKNRQYALL